MVRGRQREAVSKFVYSQDVLVSLPTGYGKSVLCLAPVSVQQGVRKPRATVYCCHSVASHSSYEEQRLHVYMYMYLSNR